MENSVIIAVLASICFLAIAFVGAIILILSRVEKFMNRSLIYLKSRNVYEAVGAVKETEDEDGVVDDGEPDIIAEAEMMNKQKVYQKNMEALTPSP